MRLEENIHDMLFQGKHWLALSQGHHDHMDRTCNMFTHYTKLLVSLMLPRLVGHMHLKGTCLLHREH